MDGGQIGLIGGIIGGALGLLGGAVGTYFSIKNTAGPRERAFMIRMSAVAWIVISAFLAGLLLLPQPYNWLLWIPYAIGLPLAIVRLNRRQAEIRAMESTARQVSSTQP
jgi:hypothetical protein